MSRHRDQKILNLYSPLIFLRERVIYRDATYQYKNFITTLRSADESGRSASLQRFAGLTARMPHNAAVSFRTLCVGLYLHATKNIKVAAYEIMLYTIITVICTIQRKHVTVISGCI